MTDAPARARAIWNWLPSTTKTEIPISELRVGDLVNGDEVVRIFADEFFVHYRVSGNPYSHGLRPEQWIQIERKK